jgi:hypothetical protein
MEKRLAPREISKERVAVEPDRFSTFYFISYTSAKHYKYARFHSNPFWIKNQELSRTS